MLSAIVGKPGYGKTYTGVRYIEKWLNEGIDVYSNVVIDETYYKLRKSTEKKPLGRLYYWNDITNFIDIHSGIVFADEFGSYFDSRDYTKFPPEVRVKFQQYRKDRLDIYYTVQSFGRTDLIVRQLTNTVIECNHLGKLFWTKEYQDVEGYEKGENVGTLAIPHFFNERIARAYDTYQEVNKRVKKDAEFTLMKDLLKGGDNIE